MRTPDHMNRKKRRITVILTPQAYLIRKQIKELNKKWDFSGWVSQKLASEFGGKQSVALRAQLQRLQQERDNIAKDFEARINATVIRIREEMEKEAKEGEIQCKSD